MGKPNHPSSHLVNLEIEKTKCYSAACTGLHLSRWASSKACLLSTSNGQLAGWYRVGLENAIVPFFAHKTLDRPSEAHGHTCSDHPRDLLNAARLWFLHVSFNLCSSPISMHTSIWQVQYHEFTEEEKMHE